MKLIKLLILCCFLSQCVACTTLRPKSCPPGTYWDSKRKVCVQIQTPKPACLDDSMVDLSKAVDIAIKCVKADNTKFNQSFASLINIARKNPDINNGETILRLIKAVAIDAPYVPAKDAKMKWNRYFAPHFFVSAAYLYESIKNYCPQKEEIKRNIDDELRDKKIGLLECMADQAHKDEVSVLYRQAEDTAVAVKKGIDAACHACCGKKELMRN